MRAKDLLNWIKYYKSEYRLNGTFNLEEISKHFNITDGETAYILLRIFVILHDQNVELRRKNELLKEYNAAIEASLEEAYKNANQRQTTLVKNGLKIRKRKMTLMDLKLFMKLNYTDQEIMDYLEISKSTLWRHKKELEEEERQKEEKKKREQIEKRYQRW